MTSGFYKDLKVEVNAHFQSHGIDSKANGHVYVKFFIFLALVMGTYIVLVNQVFASWINILLLTLGLPFFISVFIVNSLHDIIHGSFSTNPWFKEFACYLLDLIGPSSFIWKNKHNLSHHFYTNNANHDNDLNVSAILRLSSDQKKMKIHRFQHLYITAAYCLQCFFWFYISDFKNVIRGRVVTKKLIGFSFREKFFFCLNKILHLTLGIFIPGLFVGVQQALLAYLTVYAVMGLILALIFQVAHIFEGTQYHEVEKFESQDEWAKLQVIGTCVFSVESNFAHWFYGGLQFQVVHHLFPEVCHIHYKSIYPIVEKHCLKAGLPLKKFPGLFSAISSHYRQLYLLGNEQDSLRIIHAV